MYMCGDTYVCMYCIEILTEEALGPRAAPVTLVKKRNTLTVATVLRVRKMTRWSWPKYDEEMQSVTRSKSRKTVQLDGILSAQ